MTPKLIYLLVCALPNPVGQGDVLAKHLLSPQEKAALECETDSNCESVFYVACHKRHPHAQGVEGWLEAYPAVGGGK